MDTEVGRILYLTTPGEDYLQDQLLYGLRMLLGPRCVDWPRKDVMYETCPTPKSELYGRGFTLWKLLPEIEIDRGEIAADFIIGFPGETEEDFEQTVTLLHETQPQQSFIFRYSPRPGTPSEQHFEDDVPLPVKAARNLRLLHAQEIVSEAKHAAMEGGTFQVLVQGISKKDEAMLTGRTRGNHLIHFPGSTDLAGELVDVKVHGHSPVSLRGKIVG